jgi:hypothetical protein
VSTSWVQLQRWVACNRLRDIVATDIDFSHGYAVSQTAIAIVYGELLEDSM